MVQRKKRIGFKPTDEMVCDLVREELESRLKKIKSIVKDEVNTRLQPMEKRLEEMEDNVKVAFGKIQGQIEMMGSMEMKEDHALLARIERLEMSIMSIAKELENIKAFLQQMVQKSQQSEQEQKEKD